MSRISWPTGVHSLALGKWSLQPDVSECNTEVVKACLSLWSEVTVKEEGLIIDYKADRAGLHHTLTLKTEDSITHTHTQTTEQDSITHTY